MTLTLERPDVLPRPMIERGAPVERTMKTWDGAELFYRAWLPPSGAPPSRAILCFHRGHDHSGRLAELAASLMEGGTTAVFAWDARGHGRSPGARGYAADFATVVRDVDAFAGHVCEAYGIAMEDVAVVAHSVSAVAVAAWVHDYAPPIRAMVLATPALRVRLYAPLAVPALRAWRRLRGRGRAFVNSYVRPRMLTHDAAQAEAYRADPLISRGISVDVLLDLHDTATRLMADAAAIQTPTLVLTAGSDWVVKNGAIRTFFERLSSPVKRMLRYDNRFHALFHESNRQQVFADVRSFLDEAFASPAPPRKPAESAYSRTVYRRLCAPRSLACPRGWGLRGMKVLLNTVCRLSDGVRVGWRTGFDSGESLDYVYRNQPHGRTPLGRFIDRCYLNAPGWLAIRQRRRDLNEALRWCVNDLASEGRAVRLLDIAAGAGRYALDAVREHHERLPISALLRDRSESALNEGRAIARQMGVDDRVQFETGDAFDSASLAVISPRANVAVVSGLYELFDDNERLARSLEGLAAAIEPGGYLIYTNQPYHPQLEFIARVLTNRDGRPWIMRCRPQAEMDALVAAAGFRKVRTIAGSSGICTVSISRRT